MAKKITLPFPASHAFIIGINAYQNGISNLSTAVKDAQDIAELLGKTHGYTIHHAYDATQADMLALFKKMKKVVQEGDRVIFYFAGHGIAIDSEKDPEGFLVPADADPDDPKSWVSMDDLHKTLKKLATENKCKHGLLILDCCFAGAFKWSTGMRSLLLRRPATLYEELFDRFVTSDAWQVITSAAHDQKAADVLQEDVLGKRHPNSPFASALKEAITLGQADVVRGGKSDGLITATELYLYVRDRVEQETRKQGKGQSPSIFNLSIHDKGEFIFLHPGHTLTLSKEPGVNPYRGLNPYRQKDAAFFFGREKDVENMVTQLTQTAIMVITAPSGQGKTSVVQAGLFPYLEKNEGYQQFHIMRPGAQHATALLKLPKIDPAVKQLIWIDQVEELFTDTDEHENFEYVLNALLDQAEKPSSQLKIILTIRSDFEWQLKASSFGKRFWQDTNITDFLYRLPAMKLEDLRQVMIKPLWAAAYDFEKEEMVDQILAEINNAPAALPLLSFTLFKLYELRDRNSGKRLLKQHTYTYKLKGVNGVLSSHADAVYEKLSTAGQHIIRKLMLRMIRLNDGSYSCRKVYTQLTATKNTHPLNELDYPDDQDRAITEVIKTLVEEHLIVQGQDDLGIFVVPMHDSLINHWDRCLGWIKDFGKDTILLQRQLWQGVLDWKKGASPVLWDTHPKLSQVIQSILNTTPIKELPENKTALWLEVNGAEASLPLLQTLLAKGHHWLNELEVDFVQQSWEARIADVIQLKHERDEARATVLAVKARQVYPEDNTLALNFAYAAYRTMVDEETISALSFVLNEAGSQFYQRLEEHEESISFVVVSPDGSQLVSGGKDAILRLRAVPSGQEIVRFEGHSEGIICAAFSPDGKQIISGSQKGTLLLWSPGLTKAESHSFSGHQKERQITSVAFSPDGKKIVSGSRDKTLRLWSAETGKEEKCFEGNILASSVAFSPDGKYVLTGSYENSPKLWSVKSGKAHKQLDGHTDFAHAVAFSPDGKYIASGSDDHSIILWSADGALIKSLKGHTDGVKAITFSADSSLLLSGGADQTLRLWAVPSGHELRCFRGHTRFLISVAISKDKKWLFSTAYDNSLRRWAVDSGPGVKRLTGHTDKVMAAAYSPDGTQVISGSADHTLRLWSVKSGKELKCFTGHTKKVMSVAYSPDRKYILSGSYDKSIRLWEIASGLEVKKIEGHTFYVLSVAFSADGKQILSGSSDKSVRLWEVASGKEVKCFRGHEKKVTSVAFSPDKKHILSCSADKTIRLWSMASGEEVLCLKGHTKEVTSVAFSHDGTHMISGSADKRIRLWSIETGKTIKRYTGHTAKITSVAFSPDGTKILSGGSHRSVRLWSVKTGEEIMPFKGHSQPVNAVAFSPDGNHILSASDDTSLLHRKIVLNSWPPNLYQLNEEERKKYKISVEY